MKLYDKSLSTVYENGKKITLVSLTVPKYVELLSTSFIGTVNTALLSGYSEEAVSAVSISCAVINFISTFITIISTGGTYVQSYELGKNDRVEASRIVGTSVLCTVVFSAFLGLLVSFFAQNILQLMNAKDLVLDYATVYFRVCMYALPISLLLQLITAFLICNGFALDAFLVQLVNNLLNYLLCRVALAPELNILPDGVLGVSVARTLGQSGALLLALCFYFIHKCPFSFSFSIRALRRIVKIGFPGGMQNTSFHLSQTVTTAMIASLGTLAVNAKVYAAGIIQYVYLIGYAVGCSSGTMAGRFKGKGQLDRMKAFCRQNLRIAFGCNLVLSVLAFLLRNKLLTIFTKNPEIIKLAAPILLLDIAVELARAMNHIYEPMLSANGDTKTPFIVSSITCWLFGVFLSYVLGITCSLGLTGCWIAFGINELSKAIIYIFVWKKGKWKTATI